MNEYRLGIEQFIKPIALEFFATFSRFEFALKRSGYVKGNVGEKAGPNWLQFGADLGESFFQKMKTESSSQIFFEEPPKRLIVAPKQQVEFTEQAPIVNSQMLLEAIGLVRNNLFHGEKPYISDRDAALLRASLFVLDSAFVAAHNRDDLRPVCDAFRYANINSH